MGSNFKELQGILVLCDTIEEFKGLDRAAEASKIAERNLNVEELNDIYHFVIFAFADVKSSNFIIKSPILSKCSFLSKYLGQTLKNLLTWIKIH